MAELKEMSLEELEKAAGGADEGYIIHTVRRGEDLNQIARKYHVPGCMIINWNRLKGRDDIYPGQELKIYT